MLPIPDERASPMSAGEDDRHNEQERLQSFEITLASWDKLLGRATRAHKAPVSVSKVENNSR